MPKFEQIKAAFHEVLEERYGKTPSEVRIIFDWVVDKMEKEKVCSARRQKIIDTILGGVGITFVVGVLASTGTAGREIMKQIWKNLTG